MFADFTGATVTGTVAAVLLLCCGASAEPIEGDIVEAVDGDTIVVEVNGGSRTVELFGIDAPETNQPYGDLAIAETRRFVGAEAAIDVVQSSGDRIVGRVSVGGTDIGMILTDAGLAWIAEEGSSDDKYVVSILTARHLKRGLWAEEEPIHPHRWRRMHPIVHETKTVELTEIAGDISLQRDADGKVVIDSSRIPSRIARMAEGQLFVNRMVAIAHVTKWVEYADRIWHTYCTESTTADAAGSTWSEELGSWVSTSMAPRGCDDLLQQITDASKWLKYAEKVAKEEADRGGIDESDIESVSEALELDD